MIHIITVSTFVSERDFLVFKTQNKKISRIIWTWELGYRDQKGSESVASDRGKGVIKRKLSCGSFISRPIEETRLFLCPCGKPHGKEDVRDLGSIQ